MDRPPHVSTSGHLARDPPDRGVAQRLVRVRVRARVRVSVRVGVRVRVRVRVRRVAQRRRVVEENVVPPPRP